MSVSLKSQRLRGLISLQPARNPALRVTLRSLSQLKRRITRVTDHLSRHGDQDQALLCNSIPKSGTNLVLQIVKSYPGVRFYDTIILDRGIWRSNQSDQPYLIDGIRKLLPRECAAAHLPYTAQLAEILRQQQTLHFFIIRDPRDILISDLHFASRIAYWHPLYKDLNRMATDDERLYALIRGFEYGNGRVHPDFGVRMRKYLGWIDEPGTCVVRFEDLVGTSPASILERMDRYFTEHAGWAGQSDPIKTTMSVIDPGRSKTFRKGQPGEWRHQFSESHLLAFSEVASDMLQRFQYE